MDFPSDCDVLVIGTTLTETIVASSLSVVGSSVVLVDRNLHYGGENASLTYPGIVDYINLNQGKEYVPAKENKLHLPLRQSEFPHRITHFSEKWYIKDAFQAGPEANTLSESSLTNEISMMEVDTISSNNLAATDENSSIHLDTEPASMSDSDLTLRKLQTLTKSQIMTRLKRTEIDLLPKVLLAESSTLSAIVHSEVSRYTSFRFINNLLAYAQHENSASTTDSTTSSINSVATNTLFKVPVCRSDLFKSKILSLRQKRTIGSFLDWCYNLPETALDDDVYQRYKDKSLSQMLFEHFNQDEFTQRIIIENIIMSPMQVTMKHGVVRLQVLLKSSNKFGPYPMLWSMYGVADLSMGFARMAAVYGGISSLNCGFRQISLAPASHKRRLCVKLTIDQDIYTDHVVLGVNQLANLHPVRQWVARAVFITLGSLCGDEHKNTDVSMLPLPALKNDSLVHDYVPFLIESPIDVTQNDQTKLQLCNACAVTSREVESIEELFHPIIKNLFSVDSCCGDSKRPKLLLALFFQVPLYSTNEMESPDENIHLALGPDASLDLDSCVANSEKIFRRLFESLHPKREEEVPSEIEKCVTLDAFWNGEFPPRPPKQEQLIEPNIEHAITTSPTENTAPSITTTVQELKSESEELA